MQDELRQRKEEEMDDYASQVLVALLPLFDVFGIITPVLLFRLGRLVPPDSFPFCKFFQII